MIIFLGFGKFIEFSYLLLVFGNLDYVCNWQYKIYVQMRNIIFVSCLMLFCFVVQVGFGQRDIFSVFVDGICGMCEECIEIVVLKVKGVIKVDWDVDFCLFMFIIKFNYKVI